MTKQFFKHTMFSSEVNVGSRGHNNETQHSREMLEYCFLMEFTDKSRLAII